MAAISFVVARRGVDENLREEFCFFREEVYCLRNHWEITGSERDQWHFDPYPYFLILKENVVVGGCILVDSTPQNKGGKILSSRSLRDGEIEICRMINTASLGLRGLFPFYFSLLKYCIDNNISVAYADIRLKLYKMFCKAGFTCIEQIDGPWKKREEEQFVPVRFTATAAVAFFARHNLVTV